MMQYTNMVKIDLPREKVVALFDNPENLKEWMPGLVSFERISGTAGTAGAKSLLKFKMGKRQMEMTETLVSNNLPETMTFTFETTNAVNQVHVRFETIGPSSTRYVSENNFRFSGIMKFVSPLMKGMFIKTSQNYLENFKKFAEAQGENFPKK